MHHLEQSGIQSVMKKLDAHDGDVLHILNGSAMYQTFKAYKLNDLSECMPFNEAMCAHATDPDVFSTSFIQKRAAGHGVSESAYKHTVIDPLKSLFEQTYSYVVLWFGADMFCQMNLLTILAYLEQWYDINQIQVQIVDEQTYRTETIELWEIDYGSLYRKVLIDRDNPDERLMPVLEQGITLYLQYRLEDNEITNYIKAHQKVPQNELLEQLFKQFPAYGLGDVQYLNMIKQVTNRKA